MPKRNLRFLWTVAPGASVIEKVVDWADGWLLLTLLRLERFARQRRRRA